VLVHVAVIPRLEPARLRAQMEATTRTARPVVRHAAQARATPLRKVLEECLGARREVGGSGYTA
jgi:hypothetical protein